MHRGRILALANPSRPALVRLLIALAPLLIATLGAPGSAAAQARPDPPPAQATVAFGSARTLPLGPSVADLGSAPRIEVVRQSADGLDLVFELPALTVQEITLAGESYHLFEIEGGAVAGREGAPMLPTFARLIQIPDECGVTLEITGIDTAELPGYRPCPLQPEGATAWIRDPSAYTDQGDPAAEFARIGAPAILRDLRTVPITFRPLRYDPSREMVTVARRIAVTVRFAGNDPRNSAPRPAPVLPRSFDRLYRALVVNYDGPREGQTIGAGTYLIIAPDEFYVLEQLSPLIEWRTRKGAPVVLATTTETGTTEEQIKAWIQNAYDTWDAPPEYITLVGDADGAISIPCWIYSSGETDHPYVELAGDDLLPEAHIGRISVDTDATLDLYVNKIVGYESTPLMNDTDWYTHACLVGDPGVSGPTCVQIMQWLKDRLLDCGYTEVDTIFAPPFVSQMTAALNEGHTVFSYRGYWGHSGWTVGDIYFLQNGWKMPFALSITCGTGDFLGATSYSEAWIRAGTPPRYPDGGIAAVATATLGTHTRYNNCVTYGVWRGIFWEEMFTFGEALTRAKLELYINYGEYDESGCARFTHWNNLMGDPAGEIWTGVPQEMVVAHPSELPHGTNSVSVTVTRQGQPLPGAQVCLWQEGTTHAAEISDASGRAEIPLGVPLPGELQLTVTRHDHHPYLATITIAAADRFIGYHAHRIDDDLSGSSSGNSNGQVNPAEQIELPVEIRNFGSEVALGVSGVLSSSDPYILLTDAAELFGDLAPGQTLWCQDDFDLTIDGGTPNGHLCELALDLLSGSESWHSLISLTVLAPELVYEDLTLYDAGETLDPGESSSLSIRLRNAGNQSADWLAGLLVSESEWLEVTDASGQFGTIGIGAVGENSGDRFAVTAAADCLPGSLLPLTLLCETASGARDTVQLVLPVGAIATTDPTGPDCYGYMAFDDSDSGYPQAPLYEWIELAPSHGGPGIDVGLDDFNPDQDDSRVVDLPFPFVFYGQTFTQATICSNGWIAMGATPLANRRNWNIPAAGAPPYLIAPMWDNLFQRTADRVFHWYDEANHRYLIQWSRMLNAQDSGIENFELILYDPVHYPTDACDGEIVFQYEQFDNCDWLQHYCTVGIENADQTDGLLYSYYNRYAGGAAAIGSGRAIKFTPLRAPARGMLAGQVTNATNGGTPLPGVTVRLLGSDASFTSGADGSYGGSVVAGSYTLVASHASFAPDTAESVVINPQEVTVVDFALADILPPQFSATLRHPNTGDDQGPYLITTTLVEYSDLVRCDLLYNVNGAGWQAAPLQPRDAEEFGAEIPGQSAGSLIKYYLLGEDAGGRIGLDPAAAPWDSYEFWVLEPYLRDEMENGPGDWSHYVVTDGFQDQWHYTDERNHTPDGSWSWKLGEVGGGYYANRLDAALETVTLSVPGNARLTFWHWMDARISLSYPGYAYDGSVVEVSVDGGAWDAITPVGGYPYLIIHGSSPGPFPEDLPVYSGSFDWTEAEFQIEDLCGEVRLRFRFGSDGSATALGWFIDDVELIAPGPGFAGIDGESGNDAADDDRPPPAALHLHPSRPNPFAPATGTARIRFDLPHAQPVRLYVLDPAGRLVRHLLHERLAAGWHGINWDGRDALGQPLPSGVFFYQLATPHERITRRLLLVR